MNVDHLARGADEQGLVGGLVGLTVVGVVAGGLGDIPATAFAGRIEPITDGGVCRFGDTAR
ncbi:MAG: hypothetical protein L3J05_05975 [Robiginitomaculum sp.]|nr:hypothetical protein [Robiginitomaculum sp.]